MAADPYADRKKLTFEQAEGVEPLPARLKLKEVSRQLRASLWDLVYSSVFEDRDEYTDYLGDQWRSILYDKHVRREHRLADEFKPYTQEHLNHLKLIFTAGDYVKIFGFLQYVLRHERCPIAFAANVNERLEESQAAYRVVEYTIVPVASPEEATMVQKAFVDLAKTELHGARRHLLQAAAKLTGGDAPGSVRESISAVESVARVIAPTGKFSDALGEIGKLAHIHGALKTGFTAIYGYTSDEQGIRHPLLESSDAKVDDIDAQFIFGACASFVSYLVGKARVAGLLR